MNAILLLPTLLMTLSSAAPPPLLMSEVDSIVRDLTDDELYTSRTIREPSTPVADEDDDAARLTYPPNLHFTDNVPAELIEHARGDTLVLICEASGIPPPVLGWEIDGQHVPLSAFENDTNTVEVRRNVRTDTIQSGVLSCLGADTTLETMNIRCVADNGHERLVADTKLVFVEAADDVVDECRAPITKKSGTNGMSSGSPPYVFMWTDGRFERYDANVQLYCRVRGDPKPAVQWLDADGAPIKYGRLFEQLPNGDLLIKGSTLTEDDDVMTGGEYTCYATNEFGSDSVNVFYYSLDDVDELDELV